MGLLVDPIPNSQNSHHKNCMADSKEKNLLDLGSERVKKRKMCKSRKGNGKKWEMI